MEKQDNKPNCSTCKFSKEMRASAVSLETVIVCEHSPPQMVAVPQREGLAIMPVRTTVTSDIWCHQHQEKEPVGLIHG